jgi:hypothetical protein
MEGEDLLELMVCLLQREKREYKESLADKDSQEIVETKEKRA